MGPRAPRALETARLRLTAWSDADTAALAGINSDPEVVRYLGDGSMPSAAATAGQSERFAAHWDRFGFGLWAVRLRKDARAGRAAQAAAIGFAGLSHPLWLPEEAEEVEVGWRFARSAWGHGYATEAARAALDVAFGELELVHVVAYVHPANVRSQRVAARLGMHLERAVVRGDGPGWPVLVWALGAGTWSP